MYMWLTFPSSRCQKKVAHKVQTKKSGIIMNIIYVAWQLSVFIFVFSSMKKVIMMATTHEDICWCFVVIQ